jgi:AcrR family transcriptional regulator
MAGPPSPISRQESQRQTRQALVFAARAAFATEGYHGANLELIARTAGFSKGAVYSNFDGKAALFLAVMDANLEAALGEGAWDVHEQPSELDADGPGGEELSEAIRGFALATLEFIATAARDPELALELGKRMQAVTDTFVAIAEQSLPENDELSPIEAGALLAALDQGASLLTLSGSVVIDQRVLRAGMQRLLNPSAAEQHPGGDLPGEPALHDRVMRDRIAATLKDQLPSASGD